MSLPAHRSRKSGRAKPHVMVTSATAAAILVFALALPTTAHAAASGPLRVDQSDTTAPIS